MIRYYGVWVGNPGGNQEDKTRCIVQVFPNDGWIAYQCRKKRGHGPGEEYCKQHAKQVEAGINLHLGRERED